MQSLIYDLLMIIFIATCSACFSYLLDYALGQPGAKDVDDINERAIFFFWSLLLAKRRLYKDANYENIFKDRCNVGDYSILANRNEDKEHFARGRDLFSWELAFGMCIYCTGVWIALLFFCLPIIFFDLIQLNYFSNFFLLLTTPIFSHFILRKI